MTSIARPDIVDRVLAAAADRARELVAEERRLIAEDAIDVEVVVRTDRSSGDVVTSRKGRSSFATEEPVLLDESPSAKHSAVRPKGDDMSDEKRTTLYGLERGVRDEVRERSKELLEDVCPEDTLTEIADGWVPIYTYNILQVAADNMDMATLEPELGPAFDGTPTPINIIAANIYKALNAAAFKEWAKVHPKWRKKLAGND
ncbi:hypothetical protein LCGC14_2980710 [marine sediment metagenome]|uniref:Uncharacterized protein n=1 Tax=marine sediment metagenome TaxID=412755 RepID=A0A0F8X6M6_9ZZZZ